MSDWLIRLLTCILGVGRFRSSYGEVKAGLMLAPLRSRGIERVIGNEAGKVTSRLDS
jgi:hypothetical protein